MEWNYYRRFLRCEAEPNTASLSLALVLALVLDLPSVKELKLHCVVWSAMADCPAGGLRSMGKSGRRLGKAALFVVPSQQ